MKTNSLDEVQNNNLVMFPSSKNFKVDLSNSELGPDPLHDLLNEFSHLKDEDLPGYFDDRFEMDSTLVEDEIEGDAFYSLEAFMSRSLRGATQNPDDRLISLINSRIQAINEAKDRIKFYLEELEMFLPSRKR